VTNEEDNLSQTGFRFRTETTSEELPFVVQVPPSQDLFCLANIKSNEDLYGFFGEVMPTNVGKDIGIRIERFKTEARKF